MADEIFSCEQDNTQGKGLIALIESKVSKEESATALALKADKKELVVGDGLRGDGDATPLQVNLSPDADNGLSFDASGALKSEKPADNGITEVSTGSGLAGDGGAVPLQVVLSPEANNALTFDANNKLMMDNHLEKELLATRSRVYFAYYFDVKNMSGVPAKGVAGDWLSVQSQSTLDGTYYPAGMYRWNGAKWEQAFADRSSKTGHIVDLTQLADADGRVDFWKYYQDNKVHDNTRILFVGDPDNDITLDFGTVSIAKVFLVDGSVYKSSAATFIIKKNMSAWVSIDYSDTPQRIHVSTQNMGRYDYFMSDIHTIADMKALPSLNMEIPRYSYVMINGTLWMFNEMLSDGPFEDSPWIKYPDDALARRAENDAAPLKSGYWQRHKVELSTDEDNGLSYDASGALKSEKPTDAGTLAMLQVAQNDVVLGEITLFGLSVNNYDINRGDFRGGFIGAESAVIIPRDGGYSVTYSASADKVLNGFAEHELILSLYRGSTKIKEIKRVKIQIDSKDDTAYPVLSGLIDAKDGDALVMEAVTNGKDIKYTNITLSVFQHSAVVPATLGDDYMTKADFTALRVALTPNRLITRDSRKKTITKDANLDFLKSGDMTVRKGNALKISGVIPIQFNGPAYYVGGLITYIVTINGVRHNFGNSGWTLANTFTRGTFEFVFERMLDSLMFDFVEDSIVSVQLIPVLYQDANIATSTSPNLEKNGSSDGIDFEEKATEFNSAYIQLEEIINA